jgi:hypothetical protein
LEKALLKMVCVLGAVLLGTPLVAASLPEPAPERAVPSFFFGERLVYDISWAGLRVGEAVLQSESGERFNNRDVFRLVSTARSNKFLSYFYPVNDRIESIIDAKGLYPYKITIDQRHGVWQRNRVVHFDQEEHTAELLAKGRTSKYNIPPQVQDTLSSLYYFRTLPNLATGTSVFIDVHESKKNWKLEVQILGHETLRTAIGTVPSIKVKAVVLYEGLLMNKGDLYVWLTDDARRIPVLMNGKVSIGSVTATLARLEPPQLLQAP